MLSLIALFGREDTRADGVEDYYSFLSNTLGSGVKLKRVQIQWNEDRRFGALRRVRSLMQRYPLFPSFPRMLVPFGMGVRAVVNREAVRPILILAIIAMARCFGLYFASERTY